MPGTGPAPASSRPGWKNRVGLFLWVGVVILLVAEVIIRIWFDRFCDNPGWGREFCGLVKGNPGAAAAFAAGLAYVGVWWEAGRIQRSGLRIALRSILVVTPILAGIVLLVVFMYLLSGVHWS